MSLGIILPDIRKNNIHVLNHQPDDVPDFSKRLLENTKTLSNHQDERILYPYPLEGPSSGTF